MTRRSFFALCLAPLAAAAAACRSPFPARPKKTRVLMGAKASELAFGKATPGVLEVDMLTAEQVDRLVEQVEQAATHCYFPGP